MKKLELRIAQNLLEHGVQGSVVVMSENSADVTIMDEDVAKETAGIEILMTTQEAVTVVHNTLLYEGKELVENHKTNMLTVAFLEELEVYSGLFLSDSSEVTYNQTDDCEEREFVSANTVRAAKNTIVRLFPEYRDYV